MALFEALTPYFTRIDFDLYSLDAEIDLKAELYYLIEGVEDGYIRTPLQLEKAARLAVEKVFSHGFYEVNDAIVLTQVEDFLNDISTWVRNWNFQDKTIIEAWANWDAPESWRL